MTAGAFPVILSAPSGGGKTTIARRLLELRGDVGYSVSCTTRQPRAGEVDGRDYYFLSMVEFLDRRDRGDFAEYAEVHGRLYGTLRREVQRVLASGRKVLMDIDVQGAAQFVESFPDTVTIFLLPPSADALLARLTARKTEDPGSLQLRLLAAVHELHLAERYEYVVVNDDLDRAVQRVSAIIDAESVRRERIPGLDAKVHELIAHLQRRIQPGPAA